MNSQSRSPTRTNIRRLLKLMLCRKSKRSSKVVSPSSKQKKTKKCASLWPQVGSLTATLKMRMTRQLLVQELSRRTKTTQTRRKATLQTMKTMRTVKTEWKLPMQRVKPGSRPPVVTILPQSGRSQHSCKSRCSS